MEVENVVKELKEDALNLVNSLFGDTKEEVTKEVNKLIDDSKSKLKEWSIDLIKGSLTKDQLVYLLNSRKDSLILLSLKIAGVNEIKANKLATGVIDLIIEKIS